MELGSAKTSVIASFGAMVRGKPAEVFRETLKRWEKLHVGKLA